MASLTHKRKLKEKRKLARAGRSRKRDTARGTTPVFPVHVKDAPKAVLPQDPGTE